MSDGINLIPQAYRTRLKRRRIRRAVRGALALAGLLVGLVGWTMHLAVAHDRAELAGLQSRVAEMRALAADAQTLEDGIQQIQRDLMAQKRLQYPVDITAMMATVCSLMPESVTLDSMELRASQRNLEPTGKRTGRGSSTSKEAEENRQLIMICEVTGIARSDLDVADFVGRLTDHPLYQEVALDYSRPTTVRDVSGRTFRISCTVDLSRLYVVHTPPPMSEDSTDSAFILSAEVSDGA